MSIQQSSAKTGKPAPSWRTVATLLPYLWPKGAGDLKVRVVIAIVLLILAKLANVVVPVFYKQSVDALTPGNAVTAALAVPVLLIVGYGLARFAVEFFREPDANLGYLAGGLSMGQWLSLPTILAGALLIAHAAYRARRE